MRCVDTEEGCRCVWLAVTAYANARYALYSCVVLPFTVLFYAICSMLAIVLVFLQWMACVVAILGMAVIDIPIALLSIFHSGLIWSYLSSERKCLGTYCSMDWYKPAVWFNETRTSLHSKSLTETDVDSIGHEENQHVEGWMQVAYLHVADGGLLCVISLYVTIYSYVQVAGCNVRSILVLSPIFDKYEDT